ncbi:hypothetical protein FAES_4594 [Fibrella aestuarina BUZ 2]|uniref:DinB-like domain-containing protein n=1 Tax=Fibrella aestuarina BUZ 2 TaxID=1166018 RepID=I0KEP0_9BACT|nr:DUF1569 domain-containing protein [Fibrella aestuarina]CCH02593.1 hypothetical protein FAES_4594 [Fibrella aestuarina BUZ 2]
MTLTDLTNRIALLTPDSQRLWGSMSVGQMMTHCTDQLRIVLGEKDMKLRGSALTRLLTKWVGLYLPMQLPKNMKTIAELDPNRPLMTQPTTFADDRATLLATLNRLGNVPESHRFAHPVFGPLTKAEAIKLSAIHLDHHLRQFGV